MGNSLPGLMGLTPRMSHASGFAPMAKADLMRHETGELQAEIGRCFQRALSLAGVTNKEASALIGRDQAQVSRWVAGTERVQIDAVFAVAALRQPFVQALAEYIGADVETRISFPTRRSA